MGKRTTPGSEAGYNEALRKIEKPSEEGPKQAAKTEESLAENKDTTDNVHTLPTYDAVQVEAFLNLVFHSTLEADEEILTWTAGRTPGYPTSEDALLTNLPRIRREKAFYYGTSTCIAAADGNLYNRKALFKRLHVVVLDDIGTKVPEDGLPKDLKPTYVIETSPGNYQWGFVLEAPIDDLDCAQVFVSLVYNSGFTDTGGNMPTKLVRLPEGHNMKTTQDRFQVQLVHMDGPRWAPDDLLKTLQTGVSWEDIVTDSGLVRKTALAKLQGASVWSPMHLEAPSLDGIIDPALEWLYDNDMVYQERDEWVDVRCPWSAEHSDPSQDRAGYSPLGWGEGHETSRGFNCFHDACAARITQDMLEFIAAHGGPEVPAFDYVPDMLSRYVYDPGADAAWDVRTTSSNPKPLKMAAMTNLYARKVRFVTHEGKIASASPVGLWKVNPARVIVDGAEYSPGTRNRLFTDEVGSLKYNLFTMPVYEDYPIDRDRVQVFYDYITYLIPNEEEREFFLNWLAAKVKDPTFRGPALFMVADRQGTGRNTLMDMIGSMFGHRNVHHVPFSKLVSDTQFNQFQEALFISVDETLALDDFNTQRRAADRLKDIVDPRQQQVTINPKYGAQRTVNSVVSYVFLSNHTDGLTLAEGDRRFYAIRNAHEPAAPEYFGMINAWMADEGWQQHLWNDLLAREVDVTALVAPPVASDTMHEVIEAGRSAIDLAVAGFIDLWPTDLVPRKLALDTVRDIGYGNDIMPASNLEGVFRRVWNNLIPAAGRESRAVKGKFRVGVKQGDRHVDHDHPQWNVTQDAVDAYKQMETSGAVINYMSKHGIDI